MAEKETPLDKAEIEGIIAASTLGGIIASEEFGAFAELMLSGTDTIFDDVSAAAYDRYVSAISGTPTKEALDIARAKAIQDGRRQATQMTQAALNKMGDVIQDGLSKGLGPKEIAKSLDTVTGLDSNRAKTLGKVEEYLKSTGLEGEALDKALDNKAASLLKDRKETIAQTEARNITENMREIEAISEGKKYHFWTTAGDDLVSDMDIANEAEGAIPISQAFSSGHFNPPSHPNCRCTKGYTSNKEDADDTAQEIQELRKAS